MPFITFDSPLTIHPLGDWSDNETHEKKMIENEDRKNARSFHLILVFFFATVVVIGTTSSVLMDNAMHREFSRLMSQQGGTYFVPTSLLGECQTCSTWSNATGWPRQSARGGWLDTRVALASRSHSRQLRRTVYHWQWTSLGPVQCASARSRRRHATPSIANPYWLWRYYARRRSQCRRSIHSVSTSRRLDPLLYPQRFDSLFDRSMDPTSLHGEFGGRTGLVHKLDESHYS